jgi:hypothetical protein
MQTRITTLLTRGLAVRLVVVWNALLVEAASFSIDPSSLPVTVGQIFTLDVRIAGASDLYAFGFNLGFDPSLLSANSISEGAFLPSGGATLFIDGTIDNGAGTLSDTSDALNGAVPGVDGSGILATVSFTALASGTSRISLFNPILLDSGLADIPVDGIQTGSVTVLPGSTNVPEPSSFVLLGIGLTSLALGRRRRAKRR